MSRNSFGHILRGRGITTIALDFGTLDIPLLRKLYCAFKKPISAKAKLISPLGVSATSSPTPLLRSSSSGSLLLLLRCWCCCHLRRSPPVPPSAFLGLIYFFLPEIGKLHCLCTLIFSFGPAVSDSGDSARHNTAAAAALSNSVRREEREGGGGET